MSVVDRDRGVPQCEWPLEDLAALDRPQFTIDGDVVFLHGSQSRDGSCKVFPAMTICTTSGLPEMEALRIGPGGVLYSFSEIHVSSVRQTPYTLGYVDFPQGVRVLADVDAGELGTLACDMDVVLCADGERWFVKPVCGDAL